MFHVYYWREPWDHLLGPFHITRTFYQYSHKFMLSSDSYSMAGLTYDDFNTDNKEEVYYA